MKNLTNGQLSVLRAFKDFGKMDDVALTVYVHHIANDSMSSSGVRTRRAELVQKGYVTVVGTKRLKSGRRAAIHAITPSGKAALSSALSALRAEQRTARKAAQKRLAVA